MCANYFVCVCASSHICQPASHPHSPRDTYLYAQTLASNAMARAISQSLRMHACTHSKTQQRTIHTYDAPATNTRTDLASAIALWNTCVSVIVAAPLLVLLKTLLSQPRELIVSFDSVGELLLKRVMSGPEQARTHRSLPQQISRNLFM